MTLTLAAMLSVVACATPPTKEIDLAAAAIAHAVDEGAERLAPEALAAARTALGQAHDAVAQQDSRLALTRAIEAREQAELAVRLVGEQRPALRYQIEATLTAIATVRQQMQAHLTRAQTSPTSAAVIADLEATVANTDQAVQEARSALERGEDLLASERLDGVLEQLERMVDELGGEASPATPARVSG